MGPTDDFLNRIAYFSGEFNFFVWILRKKPAIKKKSCLTSRNFRAKIVPQNEEGRQPRPHPKRRQRGLISSLAVLWARCVRLRVLRHPQFFVWRCFTIGKLDHQLMPSLNMVRYFRAARKPLTESKGGSLLYNFNKRADFSRRSGGRSLRFPYSFRCVLTPDYPADLRRYCPRRACWPRRRTCPWSRPPWRLQWRGSRQPAVRHCPCSHRRRSPPAHRGRRT